MHAETVCKGACPGSCKYAEVSWPPYKGTSLFSGFCWTEWEINQSINQSVHMPNTPTLRITQLTQLTQLTHTHTHTHAYAHLRSLHTHTHKHTQHTYTNTNNTSQIRRITEGRGRNPHFSASAPLFRWARVQSYNFAAVADVTCRIHCTPAARCTLMTT